MKDIESGYQQSNKLMEIKQKTGFVTVVKQRLASPIFKLLSAVLAILVCAYAYTCMYKSLNFCKSGEIEFCVTQQPIQFTQAVSRLSIYTFLLASCLFIAGKCAEESGGCFCSNRKSKSKKKDINNDSPVLEKLVDMGSILDDSKRGTDLGSISKAGQSLSGTSLSSQSMDSE